MGKEQLANDQQTCIDVHNYLYTHVILSESQHWDGRADAHNLKWKSFHLELEGNATECLYIQLFCGSVQCEWGVFVEMCECLCECKG